MASANPIAEFPKAYKPLFTPFRYKVYYGGRGAGRSWAFAMALLILGAEKKLRILCARELQKSIRDSVHKLLTDQIEALNLGSFYEITQTSIKGKNGTEFIFEGLRHNSQQIKSYEAIDICWVEEAVTVSKASWDFLIPTIRKEGSEIWVSYNPELEEDETHQRFVVNKPSNAFVQKVSYADNPFFPEVLRQEMRDLKSRDPEDYETVWEGHCRASVEGAIYKKEMRDAEPRITKVPYNPSLPVNTFWDLGFADNTAIWFVQKVGFEYHVIDYYAHSRVFIDHYAKMLQSKPYIYGTQHLPHDGANNSILGKSAEEVLVGYGMNVQIVPRPTNSKEILEGINSARSLFPACYFDSEKCADGLQALRRYKYDVNAETGRESRLPLHDGSSHGADAFRVFATAPAVMWNVEVERAGFGDMGKMKSEYDPFEESRA